MCNHSVAAEDFFKDCPWLHVPPDRKADILIEPLYPRFGLLGGSPPASGEKTSKLAALAAARKRKEADKASSNAITESTHSDNGQQSSSLSLLSKLSSNKQAPSSVNAKPLASLTNRRRQTEESRERRAAGLPDLLDQTKTDIPIRPERSQEDASVQLPNEDSSLTAADLQALPSTFARTMIGGEASYNYHRSDTVSSWSTLFVVYPSSQDTKMFDFAEPSPDDVVLKAQNSKGSRSRQEV